MPVWLFILLSCLCFGKELRGETIYFLMGVSPQVPEPAASSRMARNGSAVIPLSDADHISIARALIVRQDDSLAPIMRVRAGRNGINRNYYDPGWPEWSWHPYEVTGFTEIVIPELSYVPKRLESDFNWSNPSEPGPLPPWSETRSVVFSQLSIIRELGPNPVIVGIAPEGEHLNFRWAATTNLVSFTLESTKSLISPEWVPVYGSWPTKTNSWSLIKPNDKAFYRVRSDR